MIKSFFNIKPLFFLLIVLFSLSSCKTDRTIDVGTFNIEWLGDGIDDKIIRSDSDYENIAEIIKFSDADVIALQEIENSEAMEKLIIYLPNYSYKLTNYAEFQNQGFLFRNDISIDEFKTYYPLKINDDTRPGAYLRIEVDNISINILSIHLKSTSRYDSTELLRNLSFKYRADQAKVINHWIDSLSELNEYFIITGDFNDNPNRKNTSIGIIYDNPNTLFLTDGFNSCKNKIWKSIDHIVISRNLSEYYLEGSSRILNIYNSELPEKLEKISDHCPVMATFVFHPL